MFMHSGDPSGQRQPDSRHKPVQTTGEGGDSERQQHVKQGETIRWEKHWAQKYTDIFFICGLEVAATDMQFRNI